MIVVLIACAAVVGSSPDIVRAQVGVGVSANIETPNVDIQINSASDFNQPLQPYGAWVDVGSYGRCWHPRDIAADWQPYTVGHWEWTDAGWYWASDEPFGWACYHYGSWYQAPQVGWVWIPSTEWAPAWVTWRYSDDYIGWAPCGPGRAVIAASFFTFCDVHHFQDHFGSRRDLIVNNTTIINRTKVVNNFSRQTVDFGGHQRTVFENRGPGIDPIKRATGRDLTPRPVRDVVRESRQPENVRRDGNQPREDQRPNEQPRRDATPSPTGRDQQRNYQQPENRQPEQQQVKPAEAKPAQRPQTPEQRPLPPTGRDEVRPAQPAHRDVAPVHPQEVPKPTPPAEPRREVPTPPAHPTAPAERPLPPTGRDEVRPPTQAPAEKPAVRPAEPARPATPAPRDGGDGHRDGHDGQ